MNDNAERTASFTSLTLELLGAKMSSELVREIWQGASQDVKESLADSILGKIKKTVETDYSAMSDIVKSQVGQLIRAEAERVAKEYLASKGINMKVDVMAKIDANWEENVNRVARDAFDLTIKEMKMKLARW